MKKLLILCSLWLVLFTSLYSSSQTLNPYVFYNNTVFGSATSGIIVNNINSGATYHKVSWTVTGGTFTTATLKVDSCTTSNPASCNDGDILGATDAHLNGSVAAISFVASYTRVRLTVYTAATGTPALNVIYTGYVNNPSGVTPAGNSGDVQTNNGSGGLGSLPVTTGGGTAILAITETTPTDGDQPFRSGGKYINATPGIATSRTDATANVTYSCTTDRNKVVIRTDANPMTDTLPAVGIGCPDGTVIYVMNTNTVAANTITLITGSTAVLPANSLTRFRSNSSTWEITTSFITTSGGVQFPATGVSAASYTNSNITVGADGRITAASSGSAATKLDTYQTSTGNPTSGLTFGSANTTKIYFMGTTTQAIKAPVSISYQIVAADNTGNLYNIGILTGAFNSTGSLNCATGATAGTTLFNSAGANKSIALSGCSDIPANTNMFLTLTCNNGCTATIGYAFSPIQPFAETAPTSGSATVNAVFNSSQGIPAATWNVTGKFPAVVLHQ